jgi:hypothetical protein
MSNPLVARIVLLSLVCALVISLAPASSSAARSTEPLRTSASPLPVTATVQKAMARLNLAAIAPAEDESEADDLPIFAVEPDSTPDFVMRSRPFVLTIDSAGAFPDDTTRPKPMSEGLGLKRLKRFLYQRGLTGDEVREAVSLYQDAAVQAIIPSPTLRASTLMMYKWDPYQASIDAILNGVNPSGVPFVAVEYADTGFSDAVATLRIDPAGQFRLIVSQDFDGEPPEQLIPVIFHETLHGGGTNSRQEEVTANILDTICYGEVVLADPRVVEFGTELSIFNNVELVGLINSMGRAGGGQVGILSSPLGDVFVGQPFESFDIESIRAAIEGDDFYSSLPGGGSTAVQTFYTVMNRFPDAPSLGESFGYGEAGLAVIDRDVGTVLTPTKVREIAMILGLGLTGPVTEDTVVGSDPNSLGERPFQPADVADFNLRGAEPQTSPPADDQAKSKLRSALKRAGAGNRERNRLAAMFDDPALAAGIPDPGLRAAVLLLGLSDPWSASYDAFTTGDETAPPLSVSFADFPSGQLVLLAPGESPDGGDQLLINSVLAGEPLEVLASYLIEGSILSSGDGTTGEAVTARLLGTLWYGRMVLDRPGLVPLRSWGTIERNRDLLALVNSGVSPENIPSAGIDNAASFGFMAPANGTTLDCLPGIYDDAASFAEFVLSEVGSEYDDATVSLQRASISERYLGFAGIPSGADSLDGTVFDTGVLAELDASLGLFLTDDEMLAIVSAMGLRIAVAA